MKLHELKRWAKETSQIKDRCILTLIERVEKLTDMLAWSSEMKCACSALDKKEECCFPCEAQKIIKQYGTDADVKL